MVKRLYQGHFYICTTNEDGTATYGTIAITTPYVTVLTVTIATISATDCST